MLSCCAHSLCLLGNACLVPACCVVRVIGDHVCSFPFASASLMFLYPRLQGMKKGIVELADLVIVNKADGALLSTGESQRQPVPQPKL